MLAIGLAVVGVLSLLAIVSDVVGPIGRGIDTAAAVLLGHGKVLVPIALIVGAVSTLAQRGTYDEDDDDGAPSRRGLRLGIGLALVCATSVGFMYLANTDGPLRDAGGVIGEAIGAPLRAGLGATGALIVLIALALLGALLVIGTGLRQIALVFAAGANFVAHQMRGLFTLPPAANADDDVSTRATAPLFDQFAPAPTVDVDLVAAEAEPEPPEAEDDLDEEAEYEDDE